VVGDVGPAEAQAATAATNAGAASTVAQGLAPIIVT
jgi:hypothetical protein